MPLIHFLLVYDRERELLLGYETFSEAGEAAAAYEALEREHRSNENLEIVLVGSDSLETVKITHGNYFDSEPVAAA